MATYIAWNETKVEFVEWKYTGGGEYDPVMEEKTITRRARWSSEDNEKAQAAAQEYVNTDVPNGWVEVIED